MRANGIPAWRGPQTSRKVAKYTTMMLPVEKYREVPEHPGRAHTQPLGLQEKFPERVTSGMSSRDGRTVKGRW